MSFEMVHQTKDKSKVYNVQHSGSTLDGSTKNFMESRFGFDFGKVMIYSDESATKSAEFVGARASTTFSLIKPDPRFEAQMVTDNQIYAPLTDYNNKEKAANIKRLAREEALDETRPERFNRFQQLLHDHGFSKWDLISLLEEFPMRDLLVLKRYGLEWPHWYTKNFQSKLKDVLYRYASDQYEMQFGRSPMMKEFTKEDEEALRKEEMKEKYINAWLVTLSNTTGSLSGSLGARITELFTDDPEMIAAGSELGTSVGGLLGSLFQATAQRNTYVPEIEHLFTGSGSKPIPTLKSGKTKNAYGNPEAGEIIERKPGSMFEDLSDEEMDAALNSMETPKVKGSRSRPYIDNHRVPTKQRMRMDIEDVPTLAGETSREAIARVNRIIKKKISEIPELNQAWIRAREHILRSHILTRNNYEELYDLTRNRFWKEVRGEPTAINHFTEAGFMFPESETTAPILDGVSRDIPIVETRVSLDHIQEKAIGDNWQHALDANNLRMEFANPNTYRETIQARHPELRE